MKLSFSKIMQNMNSNVNISGLKQDISKIETDLKLLKSLY